MAAIKVVLTLSCLGGGVLGCMTSQICSGYQSEAMAQLTSSNITGYCRLQSKSIACYTGDIADCTDPGTVLEATYSAYYNTCALTGADVTSCSMMTSSSCREERLNVLDNDDMTEYCRDMEIYMTCIAQNMTLCHSRVTIFDVLGGEYASYDQMCSDAAATMRCQALTFGNCSSLLPGNQEASLEDTCRIMKAFLDCANTTMQHCHPLANKTEVIGPFETSYTIQCSKCPAISTCLQEVQGTAPPSGQGPGADNPATSNFLQECGNMGTMFTCMERELGSCNISSPRPYTFQNITHLYDSACQELLVSSELTTCSQMSTCMSTPPISPSANLEELMALYNDPEFWCTILRHGLECAYNLTDVCSANTTVVTELLGRTNQICFGGDPPSPVSTSPDSTVSSTSGTTSNDGSNDTSRGSKLDISILVFLAVPLLRKLGAV